MQKIVGIICWLVSCCAIATATQANEQSFAAWQQEFKAEAQSQGISASLLDKAFAGLSPNDKVIRLDRKQPESTMTLTTYLKRVVSKQRIQKGQRLAKEHQALLQQVSQKYGVQPRFILALWGIETSYGKITGGFSIVEALATLAYDGRRSKFFRKELLNALQIVDQGHISLADFKGSWAGAMGQTQFMPSSFLSYAVDFDEDGRKDIWHSLPDIFASIANYLANTGWNDDETWGRKVSVPTGFNTSLITGKQKKNLPAWSAMGVTKTSGAALPPRADLEGALLYPGEPHEGTYLIYENFNRIMRWNRSHYFATAVGTLSDAIAYGK